MSFYLETDLMAQERRRLQRRKRTRLFRYYSGCVLGQLLLNASFEPFRQPGSCVLGKTRSKLRRVQKLAQEWDQYNKFVAEDVAQRERSENRNKRWREEHQKALKRYGLPEDTSIGELREYAHTQYREREARRIDTEIETAALQQLVDETKGDWKKTITILQSHCAEHPDSEVGGIFLIRTLRDQGRFDEAIDESRRQLVRIDQQPTRQDLQMWIRKQSIGEMLLEKGAIQEGMRYLEQTLAKQEESD